MSYGSTLYPNKLSLGLLEELYDEYLPLFTSDNFNVGGDEPWELGHGRSKARCEKLGTARVYADFLDQIHKRVKARDRQMMFWSDIVLKEPDSLKHASKHATALNWGYEGNHPFQRECRQMQAAGMPYYVCPGTSSWNALTGRIDNASKNLASAARAGIANGAIGYLITDWGDHGHHQYLPTSFPGFLMGASHAWNHRSSKNLNVIDGLNRVFFADNGGKSGAVLWQLGKVLEFAPSPIRNATIFNRLLFWRMQHEPGATRKITNAQLQACEEAFLGLSEQLADIGPRYDSELIRDEFDNAIRLARHGIHRLQLFRGERRDRSSLRSELKHGIAEHERLWLSRNRPGGLRESSGHLAQSLAALS